MSLEEYPEDIEIKKSNFKTDQQEEAAETIAEEWPVDLETLAEEGQHVKVFYSQVLDQFLGPDETELTFSEIESEYGGVEQWAESAGDAETASDGDTEAESESEVAVSDVDDIEPAGGDDDSRSTAGVGVSDASNGTSTGGTDTGTTQADASMLPDAEDLAGDADAEAVDERRRAWFAAGFREGVEFALKNPDLVADRSEE